MILLHGTPIFITASGKNWYIVDSYEILKYYPIIGLGTYQVSFNWRNKQ